MFSAQNTETKKTELWGQSNLPAKSIQPAQNPMSLTEKLEHVV
jgi:hypothetical protein